MRPHRFLSFAAAAATACTAGAPGSAPAPARGAVQTVAAITEADLRTRLFKIAADSMMGRESGSEGAYKASAYVAAEFARLGLEPAGDNGGWFQNLPMTWVMVDPASRLDASGFSFAPGKDFYPTNAAAPATTLTGVDVVYGGDGSDSTTWIAPAAAMGKFVVLAFPEGRCCQSIAAPRWRGAATIAGIGLEQLAPEGMARNLNGRPLTGQFTTNPNALPTIIISKRAATALLGADASTLQRGARGRLAGGHFGYVNVPTPFAARNVVGILRGTDSRLRNEYVALTAHHDHVGFDHTPVDHDSTRAYQQVVRPMGADSRYRPPTTDEAAKIRVILDSLRRVNRPRMDSIRNGADDDGSGTVAILEIAELLAQPGMRPRRSILFVSHTSEESGLSGSRWYTAHATVPVDSIVGEIDEDMVGRGKPTDMPRGNGTIAADAQYLEVIGAKRLSREFGDTLEAVNARQPLPFKFDYTYDAPGHPLQYYCRADHYNYAKYGIPSVAFSRGEHLDYHQVTDEAQYISYPDLRRVTQMVADMARAIGNMPARPQLSVPKPTDPNAPCRQ
jgi:hypothetical protein